MPASERKKQLVINTTEDLWYFQNCLLKDLRRCGEDVDGYIDHMEYMSEMARTNVFEVRALVSYDEEMLERARRGGPSVFHGADTQLSNTKLGAAGTKAANRGSHDSSRNRGGSNRNRGGTRSGGYSRSEGPKALTGWRKVAAERGICFKYCQNAPCDTNPCQFKHKCVMCDGASHAMWECTVKKSADNRV